MHRRSQQNQDLVPLDLEIEAAARQCHGEARRKKRAEVEMDGQDQRVLRDYATPQASGTTSSIVNPTIEANNFKLSPALITFVERDQFGGHPADNHNAHLRKFLAKMTPSRLTGNPQRRFDCDSSLSH